MMAKFFNDCTTVEEVKTAYRRMAFEYHPDHGGDAEIFKRMSTEYQDVLKWFDGEKSTGSDGKEHTYRYDEAQETVAMQIIADLLSLRLQDVEILLIGIFVWVVGNTKPRKDEIKAIAEKYEEYKVQWHGKKKCWYFKPAGYRSFSKRNISLGEIAGRYGYQAFGSDDDAVTKTG